jgi:hypothetical protein
LSLLPSCLTPAPFLSVSLSLIILGSIRRKTPRCSPLRGKKIKKVRHVRGAALFLQHGR